MAGVLIKKEKFRDTKKHTQGRRPYDNGIRDWTDAATRHRTPKIAGSQQKPGRGKSLQR